MPKQDDSRPLKDKIPDFWYSSIKSDLALGLNELPNATRPTRPFYVLPTFAEYTNSIQYLEWKGKFYEASEFTSEDGFEDVFRLVTKRVEGVINFNLDGLNGLDNFLGKHGDTPFMYRSEGGLKVTEWELHTILTNPELLSRTIFYRNMDPVPTSEVLKQVGASTPK